MSLACSTKPPTVPGPLPASCPRTTSSLLSSAPLSSARLGSALRSPLLVAVALLRLGKITKSCFVREMQLLKSDEIQLKREGSRWVNNATPPFPEYQAAAPCLPPPPDCTRTRTRTRAHTQTSYHVKIQTPTRQRRGNTHMSGERPRQSCCPLKRVCITGIIHAVGANWQKLEEATSNDCNNTNTDPSAGLVQVQLLFILGIR